MTSIGLMTCGGDCPGLNAAIRAVVYRSSQRHVKVKGIKNGFEGLIENQLIDLNRDNTSHILNRGGSILGCSGVNPFRDNNTKKQNTIKTFRSHNLDALIVIGGNSSMGTALMAQESGIPVVGVPKTIDNDVAGTDITIGFDTAVATAADAIDRLRTTAESHDRVMIIETMGRDFGWIAVAASLAGGADIVLTPEEPINTREVANTILKREASGKEFTIIVIGEGATFAGEKIQYGQIERRSGMLQLSGVGSKLSERLDLIKPNRWRLTVSVIGHLQRGGTPSSNDRILATRFGVFAADMAIDGPHGNMVAMLNGKTGITPLTDVAGQLKSIDPDLLKTARAFDEYS